MHDAHFPYNHWVSQYPYPDLPSHQPATTSSMTPSRSSYDIPVCQATRVVPGSTAHTPLAFQSLQNEFSESIPNDLLAFSSHRGPSSHTPRNAIMTNCNSDSSNFTFPASTSALMNGFSRNHYAHSPSDYYSSPNNTPPWNCGPRFNEETRSFHFTMPDAGAAQPSFSIQSGLELRSAVPSHSAAYAQPACRDPQESSYPTGTHAIPTSSPSLSGISPRETVCQWVVGDGILCERWVTYKDVPDHLATHGVIKLPHDHLVSCKWSGCGQTMKRESIARHVRERHLGYNRGKYKRL
ncbi:hypothetical protein JVU11DRAFT_7630 [Chiua virens]|nr:hypothetical protein JVU11DRAFT_7630 [Chiua virens]